MTKMNATIYSIDKLYEEYKTAGRTGKETQGSKQYLKYLLSYLKKYHPSLNIDQQTIRLYKNYIFELKKVNGYYFSARWMLCNLKNARTFLDWLGAKKIIPVNPLKNFKEKQQLKEFQHQIDSRRLSKLQQNRGFYNNEQLLKLFFQHIKQYSCETTIKHALRTMNSLKQYCDKKQKHFEKFSQDDLDELINNWMNITFNPSLIIANRTLYHMCYALKNFYYWLYIEGYKQEHFLKDFSEKNHVRYIDKKKEELLKAIKLKQRRYTVKEILKSYRYYLEKNYENFHDIQDLYSGLKQFLRFVVSKGKDLYTVDAVIIASYKDYLFHYEYFPRKFYTPCGQSDKIRAVKRFYDWFYINGYVAINHLKDFMVTTYQKSITEAYLNRKIIKQVSEEVPKCFEDIYNSVLNHEKSKQITKGTMSHRKRGWQNFFSFLEKNDITDMNQVDEPVLNDYMVFIENAKNIKGKIISVHTRIRYLVAVKSLFRYLARFKFLKRDPSFCIQLPKTQRGLPTVGMNHSEVSKILKRIHTDTPKAIRDKALIETLYSTGIRSNELRNLKLEDIDYNSGMVRINVPKGGINYQRVVPIGKMALNAISDYITKVRNQQDKAGNPYLFLNKAGGQITTTTILIIVKTWKVKARLRKNVVTHSFRVSCATEMLKGKADIKFVQQQLGHVSIGTTERYLRLVPGDLKKIHKQTHPRERRIKEEVK